MNDQILDSEALEISIEPIQKHRLGAILLEVIPILLIVLGVFMGNLELIGSFILILFALYPFAGWYLFKGDKYRAKDIVFVTIMAFLPAFFMVVSVVYKILSWPGADEMFVVSLYSFPIFIVICGIWYLFHRHRPLEWRLSLKLLSRIALFWFLQSFFFLFF